MENWIVTFTDANGKNEIDVEKQVQDYNEAYKWAKKKLIGIERFVKIKEIRKKNEIK